MEKQTKARVCLVCGKLFERKKHSNSRQKFCTLKCRSKNYYTKYYKHFTWKSERVCYLCKSKFIPKRINQNYCSPNCSKKNWKVVHRIEVLKKERLYNKKRKGDPIKKEQDKLTRKIWRDNNKDKRYSYKRAYRARKYGNGGSHTKIEWEAIKYAYDYTCQICQKREPEIKLTEDHIIPLTKGGEDNIDNIQPLCHVCNSFKNNHILDSFPQTNVSSPLGE